jgi:hypothetical protein
LNAEGPAASAVGEGGRIQDHGVEFFATPGQPGKDSADILRPESVPGTTELISFVIFLSPLEGAGRGIDIQGFGSVSGGDRAKGAGMGEEVEQLLGSEGAKPNAVIPLIGEKTRGDSRGEVDSIHQSEFLGFSKSSPCLTILFQMISQVKSFLLYARMNIFFSIPFLLLFHGSSGEEYSLV